MTMTMTANNILVDEFKIGDVSYPSTFKQDVYINKSNLSEEFADHSERFAWYATAYELALDVELRAKEHLGRIYARIDAHVREQARESSVKLTEKMVENTVITHPEYVKSLDNYLDAKLQTGLLKACRDGMVQRKDMLVSLGANYRAEGKSDISLKEEAYRRL